MNILIPTILSTKRKVGVTQYLINLIDSLQEVDDRNSYFIVTTSDNHFFFKIYKNNFFEVRIKIKEFSRVQLRIMYLLWSIIYLPKIVKKYKIDLVHSPCAWFVNKEIKTITTIHDLIEYKTNKYGMVFNMIKKNMIGSSIKNSIRIISVSNSTREDIKNTFNKESILIYNGFKEEEIAGNWELISKKYGIHQKMYFIFIGTIQKHKNLNKLIEAYANFSLCYKHYSLVLVGKPDNAQKDLLKMIKKLNLDTKVLLTGHVSEDEKTNLLKNAFALLLISKYEGFGFPVLEAQSLNIPVIISDNSSLPEVAGNAALYVKNHNVVDISKKMMCLVEDKKLYESLTREGRENIKRFSWRESALKTIRTYDSV